MLSAHSLTASCCNVRHEPMVYMAVRKAYQLTNSQVITEYVTHDLLHSIHYTASFRRVRKIAKSVY